MFSEAMVLETKYKGGIGMDYKEKIIEMVEEIKNQKILHCIYIFVFDIMKEDKEDGKDGTFKN